MHTYSFCDGMYKRRPTRPTGANSTNGAQGPAGAIWNGAPGPAGVPDHGAYRHSQCSLRYSRLTTPL